MKNTLRVLMIACLVLPIAAVMVGCSGAKTYAMVGDYRFEGIKFNGQYFTADDFARIEVQIWYCETCDELSDDGKCLDASCSDAELEVEAFSEATGLSARGKAKLDTAYDKFTAAEKLKLARWPGEDVKASYDRFLVKIFNYENFYTALWIKYNEESGVYTHYGADIGYDSALGKLEMYGEEFTYDRNSATLVSTYEEQVDSNFKVVITAHHKNTKLVALKKDDMLMYILIGVGAGLVLGVATVTLVYLKSRKKSTKAA